MSKRNIEFDFSAGAQGSVLKIDGEPVQGVRAATVTMRMGQPTTVVVLELVGSPVSGKAIEADAVLVETTSVESSTREFLPA